VANFQVILRIGVLWNSIVCTLCSSLENR